MIWVFKEEIFVEDEGKKEEEGLVAVAVVVEGLLFVFLFDLGD